METTRSTIRHSGANMPYKFVGRVRSNPPDQTRSELQSYIWHKRLINQMTAVSEKEAPMSARRDEKRPVRNGGQGSEKMKKELSENKDDAGQSEVQAFIPIRSTPTV